MDLGCGWLPRLLFTIYTGELEQVQKKDSPLGRLSLIQKYTAGFRCPLSLGLGWARFFPFER
jgi:hypothetical protein